MITKKQLCKLFLLLFSSTLTATPTAVTIAAGDDWSVSTRATAVNQGGFFFEYPAPTKKYLNLLKCATVLGF